MLELYSIEEAFRYARERQYTGFIRVENWKIYFTKGVVHREDGPAYYSRVIKIWYKNGVMHREDGPAGIYNLSSRSLTWWLHGTRYSKEEWFEQLTSEQKIVALCNPENLE